MIFTNINKLTQYDNLSAFASKSQTSTTHVVTQKSFTNINSNFKLLDFLRHAFP